MIKREVCPNCNGRLVPFGNGILKCECCHSVFDDVSITDEERSLLIAAAKLLRDGKFEEADEAYRDIVSSNPRNHEAYYGRALARHGIVFVSDLRAGAGKKVPTCYITDVGSFIDDVNYKLNKFTYNLDIKENEFTLIDKNGNGEISYYEFCKYAIQKQLDLEDDEDFYDKGRCFRLIMFFDS